MTPIRCSCAPAPRRKHRSFHQSPDPTSPQPPPSPFSRAVHESCAFPLRFAFYAPALARPPSEPPHRSEQTRSGSNGRGSSCRAQDGGHARENVLRVLFLSHVCIGSGLERPKLATPLLGGGQQNARSTAQDSVGPDSADHRRTI